MHEVALFELGLDGHGPRLLGRTSDPDLVDSVREHLVAARRRQIADLAEPVRLVRQHADEDGNASRET